MRQSTTSNRRLTETKPKSPQKDLKDTVSAAPIVKATIPKIFT